MKWLKQLAEESHIPAISIASTSSLQKGAIDTQAEGVLDTSGQTQVGESSVFEAASLTKPVFAYIVLKLAEQGLLNLDQPLYQICDFGPPTEIMRQHPNYQQLTARMILSHQAGLPNWFQRKKPETFDYIAKAGERFDYSGEAFCFLREVIEFISKESLETIAQKEFKKIGMVNSSFMQIGEGNRAVGHHADGTPGKSNFFGINPAASLHTTALDYVRFLRACMNDPYIKAQMFAKQVELSGKDVKASEAGVSIEILEQLSWGLGIGLQKASDGGVIAFHWGDNETCRNFAALKLNVDGTYQTVACFANSANGSRVFRQVCEPIVGDLTAVANWLTLREHLEINQPTLTQPKPASTQKLIKQYQSYIDSNKPTESQSKVANDQSAKFRK